MNATSTPSSGEQKRNTEWDNEATGNPGREDHEDTRDYTHPHGSPGRTGVHSESDEPEGEATGNPGREDHEDTRDYTHPHGNPGHSR